MTDLPALVRRACLAEATARKPGNVHPGARFPDLTYDHFVAAAHVAAETLPAAGEIGVGPAVLNCVRATVAECGTNVNLGVALLLAPLCIVPRDRPLAAGLAPALAATTIDDAAAMYEAIRLANPGGLGEANEQDVRSEPTVPLRDAMRLAADRDDVAREWAAGFSDTARRAADLARFWPRRAAGPAAGGWEDAVLWSFLSTLRARPDTHIARRCGAEEAERVRRHVRATWGRFRPPAAGQSWVRALDRFLRADGHRRNPGTTADLICAALFWAAREGTIELPTEAELADHAARVRGGGVE